MTKQTFTAFGVVRTSDNDYPFASCDNNGTVRFHQSRDAAQRFSRFARTEVITAAEARTIKANAEAKRQRRIQDERQVEQCLWDGGDWRTLREELTAKRHAEEKAMGWS